MIEKIGLRPCISSPFENLGFVVKVLDDYMLTFDDDGNLSKEDTTIDAYPHCNDWTKAENKYYCDAVNRLYSDATNNTYVYDKPKTEKSFIPKIFKVFSRR